MKLCEIWNYMLGKKTDNLTSVEWRKSDAGLLLNIWWSFIRNLLDLTRLSVKNVSIRSSCLMISLLINHLPRTTSFPYSQILSKILITTGCFSIDYFYKDLIQVNKKWFTYVITKSCCLWNCASGWILTER